MRIFLILIMIGFCFGMFAQEKEKFVLYPESIDPKTKSYSKEYLEQHYQDYLKMYFNAEWSIVDYYPYKLYYNKVNIKEYKKFKEIGLDFEEFNKHNYIHQNVNELSIFCHLVFTGTVVRETDIPDLTSHYRKYITVEIDEILRGNGLFEKQPKVIKIFNTKGKITFEVNGKKGVDFGSFNMMEYEVGKKYLIVVSFRGEDYENKYKNNHYINYFNGGVNTFYADKENYIKVDIKDPADFSDRTNLRQADFITYDKDEVSKLREFLKRYEEINDTPNFYNRSYK